MADEFHLLYPKMSDEVIEIQHVIGEVVVPAGANPTAVAMAAAIGRNNPKIRECFLKCTDERLPTPRLIEKAMNQDQGLGHPLSPFEVMERQAPDIDGMFIGFQEISSLSRPRFCVGRRTRGPNRDSVRLCLVQRNFHKVLALVGPTKGTDFFDNPAEYGDDDLRGARKRRFTKWAGKSLILVRKVGFVIGMGMIEGLQLLAAEFGLLNNALQFFWVHGVSDDSCTGVSLGIELVKAILNICQPVNAIASCIGENDAATFFGESFFGMRPDFFYGLFRKRQGFRHIHRQ
jgi:hypothetical protein